MKHICYCIHSLYNAGGMESIISHKANYLSKYGYKVSIITTEQKNKKTFFELDTRVQLYDLGVNYKDDQHRGYFFKSIGFWKRIWRHKKELKNLLLYLKPDVVISTFGNEALFLHGINDGSKKIIEIHFSKLFRLQLNRKGLWRWIDRIRTYIDECIVKKYDKFIVLTHEDKLLWGNLRNIQVIPNFITISPESRMALTHHCVVAVGRLSYQKGFDRLLQIWYIVNSKYPNWKLKIYGAGELKEDIINNIQLLGLDKSVAICDPIHNISDIYNEADIFVLTSRYEGLPMVLLEAMSYGLPIVSFDCKCGPRDLINHGYNGYIVRDGDIKEFANYLMSLISQGEKRCEMSMRAKQMINTYSDINIMKKWINLFETL